MSLISRTIKIKEKDYEYFEKNRKIKLQRVTNDPLKNPKKQETFTNSALKGLKSEALKPTLAQDPLSRKIPIQDPLAFGKSAIAKKNDPLSRSGNYNAAKSEFSDSNETKEGFAIVKKTDNENVAVKEKTLEFKNAETKKENSTWTQIRNEFVQNFDLRNIEHFVNNPFGNIAIQEDKIIKQARHGENRLDFEDYSIKKPGFAAISEKVYLKNIENMNKEMKHYWEVQDKVASLQVTIQSCKLLVENDFPKFYPVKFVFVMDILEQFGIFVFERMKALSFVNLSEEKIFEMADNTIIGKTITESAQEICKNWLLKIGSIRELIPRMYIEAALLKLYFFIDGSKMKHILMRLAMMSRSIGDTMSSVYFSTYLLRVSGEICPKEKSHILLILDDFLNLMKNPAKFCHPQINNPEEFLKLFNPFFNALFSIFSENCSPQEFKDLLSIFTNSSKHPEILKRLIANSNPVNICQGALDIYNLIKPSPLKTRNELYPDFLSKLVKCIPGQSVCEALCNGMWKDISQSTVFSDFLNMVANLIDLIYKSFKGFQKNQFFHQMLDKFNDFFLTLDSNVSAKNYDIFYKLEDFLKKILANCDDISEILSLEPFLQFIQYFPDAIKPNVCKNILNIFVEKDSSEKIRDPVSVHSILSIARNLNSDYTAVVSSEERKSINDLLNKFMKKVDFGKDLEQSLNLHTEVRGHFGNIPEIIENLIYKTIDLTLKARRFSKGKVNKKIAGFIQACIAYCYISIPSVEDSNLQLRLYLAVSQSALMHNMISQSEGIFKTAIVSVSELPEVFEGRQSDALFQGFLKNLISFMIVLPENPENDYLHVLSGFKNAIDVFKWNKKTGIFYKITFLLDFLAYLCIQLQNKLPYHIENVKSNDALFAETEFKTEIIKKINEILNEISTSQTELDFSNNDSNVTIENCKVCIYSINVLIQYFEPNEQISKVIRNFIIILRKRLNDLRQEKSFRTMLERLSKSVYSTFENINKNYNDIEIAKLNEEIIPYLK